MKKQVIIDKGNGLQQRLSYDDSTNKIIPELNIGPSLVDNVLPVVGKKFIEETGLLTPHGEDCIFCKGKVNYTGISFNTQCELLMGIKASYSPVAGPVHQTCFYSLAYKGIPTDFKFQLIFYDVKNVPVKFLEVGVDFFPISFYLHQNSIYKVEIRLKKGKIYGECRLKIEVKGQPILNAYKDPNSMSIVVDYFNNLILYSNKNPTANLDYVYLIFNSLINSGSWVQYKLTNGVVRDFPSTLPVVEGWVDNGVEDLINKEYSSGGTLIALLNYESLLPFNMYSNLFYMRQGNLDKKTGNDIPNGG